MAEALTIAQVSRLTGLASHTIRYYEKQFPELLDVERTRGGHRIYRKNHLEALNRIITLVRDKKTPIKEARTMLEKHSDMESYSNNYYSTNESESISQINSVLIMVLRRLEDICRDNKRQEDRLTRYLESGKEKDKQELLDQVKRCRNETKETMNLYQTLINQKIS